MRSKKQKDKVKKFLDELKNKVDNADSVTIYQMDSWREFSDCPKELKMVEGAMATVGDADELGTGYMVRILVK